ncbi:Lrp/AsnC family transcriptional regulator [Aliiroseovarius crassostreae]|uniref:Lrp/AsnC family transcriptional regulator n=1 Tax=Aliiroseovarius crassostreae TaxID=154981 RepID=UPI00220CC1AD|nr:Lrp/AsnC family transcriptional regulator [Aliiroseovarius crassostreae]UWP88453.1 Lrp/AsnC family transcriptional regulator [Aliiroseovarius crassostreae]UWP91617.1 Lrp/AsnC family transcriptional regulator [Aliiroseovarius crassostreae]UWP97924.1 Lrp/AsnC family transcriptional regulator [Aliiroseovarius crassostreae]
MDATDRRIISALQQSGRQKLGDLAEEVGLSPTPCARRVAALEDSGVITGYGARVDQAKLGLPVTVFIEVELESQKREAISAFERAISRMEEVMECHLMSGSRDILLRVVVADLASFDAFMENHLMRVEGVSRMRSSFTLRTMVRRNRLPMG